MTIAMDLVRLPREARAEATGGFNRLETNRVLDYHALRDAGSVFAL